MSAYDAPASIYDEIGIGYTAGRQEDPSIACQIHAALGDARSVLNVGAGAGAYEPRDCNVLAVEPSEVMRAQRPADAAPCINATAEALPLPDKSFDVVMVLLSLHHWKDWQRGMREVRRVARHRVVIFTYDPTCAAWFWLKRDYLPELMNLDIERFPTIEEQADEAGRSAIVEPVPLQHDCRDGFAGAYWRRPHAYLDPEVRACISTFRLPGAQDLIGGLRQLEADLKTGAWTERNEDILDLTELDLGYRLIVAEQD